ncbi:MAG: hypothetical protein LBQ57_09695 [Spirochaetales bacterium]|jgi:hypothetical protein|nr:hypothetical protein [Spirochaetales bacterium]
MLVSVLGYFKAGKFVPDEDITIPEDKKAIVTILDGETIRPRTNAEAWKELFDLIAASSDEEIPEEFPRVNFNREIDL